MKDTVSSFPTAPIARNSDSLIARRHAVVSRGVAQAVGDATVATARGARLIDVDGVEFIDFAGGIGTVNSGHNAPEVVAAIHEQAERLLHACIHVATYEPYVALCERLVALLPHGTEGTKAMLCTTGAEAVENAVKIARQATGRPAVICFSEAFHGRTMMAMTLTSKTALKLGCGPFAPEVHRLDFPNHFLRGDGLSEDAFVQRELARFREALRNRVPAEHIAAVIIEPVQGEGGFTPAPLNYLRGLRAICDEFGFLLIVDEVQSGFGRTGRWAAYEHSGITPDLSVWAKSLGGGLPIAAVVGRASVMDAVQPGTLGGTFGGNPVACAAALANIGVFESRGLIERGAVLGAHIRERLDALAERCELVGNVRGLGAMLGIELCHGRDPRRPATDAARAVMQLCLARGVVVLLAGISSNVIRVLCPLVIEGANLARGLTILEDAILEVAQMQEAQ